MGQTKQGNRRKAKRAAGVLKEFSISVSEANADPERLLRRVKPGLAACITRYGKPYVYMISTPDYRRLVRNYRRRMARQLKRLTSSPDT